jgi:hypothetical protein
MHSFLLGGSTRSFQIDHVNGNGLDNRRENLRRCSTSEQARNRPKQLNARSRFKGVWWSKTAEKWQSSIMLSGKSVHLGIFDEEVSAAVAYDRAAREHFGEFARTNFPL